MAQISLFEEKQVRRAWNAQQEKWMFAIVDVIAILTGSTNPQTYWRVLKKRLNDEGNETVTKCNGLKITAADGKQRMTDVADNLTACNLTAWHILNLTAWHILKSSSSFSPYLPKPFLKQSGDPASSSTVFFGSRSHFSYAP
jgi:hypothetical protein